MELVVQSEEKKNFIYQYVATLTGSIIIVNTGMHLAWPATALPQLLDKDSYISMTSAQGSWVVAMPFLGAMLGAILEAMIVNKIGRKTAQLLVSPIYLITWLGIAYAPSVTLLYVARFLVGFGDGIALSAFPIYVGEISHSTIRGFLASSIAVMLYSGFLIITILGSSFTICTTALLASIFSIVHFVTFCWMPETPYFYLMKGKFNEARDSLAKLRGTTKIEEEFQRMKQAIKESSIKNGHWYDLFTVRSNRKGLFIFLGLKSIQQLSGNAVIAFYIQLIFDEAKIAISPMTATIAYFSLKLISAIISSILVDKLGRRILLLGSLITVILALLGEGCYFYLQKETNFDVSRINYLPLVCLLAYVVLFTLGVGTVLSVSAAELFSTNVKAFALCLSDIYYGFLVAFLSKLFQITKDAYGMYVPFFGFAVSCAVGFVFIMFYVPETKGKTLEEIQMLLKGRPVKTTTGMTTTVQKPTISNHN